MATLTRTDAKNKLSTLEMKTRGRSITETDYFQMRALCMELAEVADGLRESAEEAMTDAKRYRFIRELSFGFDMKLNVTRHSEDDDQSVANRWALNPVYLDKAIDAAIAESDEEEKR